MGASFSARNLIYWWAFLTSFIFLQQPTRELARTFRDAKLFTSEAFPFNLATGITRWLDDRATQIVKAFQFDPNVIVVKLGSTVILDGFRVGIILAVLLLVLAIRYYLRAIASPRVYDDVIAIVIFFFVYHIEAQTLQAIKVPLGTQMVQDRSAWVWFLAFVILAMVLGGRGFHDSRVFWKGVLELFLVWLFLIPQAAAGAFAALLEALANFGQTLQNPSNISIALIWALIGLLAAIRRLYASESDGGGGGPGLLARLRGGRAKG